MAMAPPRPCSIPKCGRINCQRHVATDWRPRAGPPVPRIRGRELQRRRARLFAKNPWCVRCLKQGRQTRATIRDHVIPLGEGGRDDETNEQALCATCSKEKTNEESKRGARRAR
jgi:5-methylcytosine-specific restriction enzyme A